MTDKRLTARERIDLEAAEAEAELSSGKPPRKERRGNKRDPLTEDNYHLAAFKYCEYRQRGMSSKVAYGKVEEFMAELGIHTAEGHIQNIISDSLSKCVTGDEFRALPSLKRKPALQEMFSYLSELKND